MMILIKKGAPDGAARGGMAHEEQNGPVARLGLVHVHWLANRE
jgi:hypothetical protein